MSLLIKGGEIVDGSGSAPKKCDVLVVHNHIAAIGNLSSCKADKVIQALGSYILPGFIDVAVTSDERLTLFSEPSQADFLKNGVTTIVCGTRGESLAPAMYAEETPFLNIGWQTVKDYIKAIHALRLGVNFINVSGYETIRRAITLKSRNLGIGEIKALSILLKQCLADGSAGVSIGRGGFALFDASEDEINAFTTITSQAKKTVFTSLKTTDNSHERLMESGSKIIISDLNESLKTQNAFDKFTASAEKNSLKTEFAFSFSPYPYLECKASEMFPDTTNLTDATEISKSLSKKRTFAFFSKKIQELHPQETFIFNAPRKETKFLTGKSVAEFAENRKISAEEAFIRIIEICGPDTVFISRMANDKIIDKIITHPKSIVGSSSWSPMSSLSTIHSALSEPFITFIRSADNLGMRIEFVAKKLAYPARLLGLKKRGLIKEGFAADIVILKNNRPEFTIVNGKIAYENGFIVSALRGTSHNEISRFGETMTIF